MIGRVALSGGEKRYRRERSVSLLEWCRADARLWIIQKTSKAVERQQTDDPGQLRRYCGERDGLQGDRRLASPLLIPFCVMGPQYV
jgi:hypothetical protein